MEMSKYCKRKGFSRDEFKEYAEKVESTALKSKETAISLHGQDNGVYYSIGEILKKGKDEDFYYFVIDAMKKIGFEFILEKGLYRI